MEYDKFQLKIEKCFKREFPELLIQNEKGFLKIKDKKGKEYPSVDIKSLYINLEDKEEVCNDIIINLVSAYEKKSGVERVVSPAKEKIVFICENKEQSLIIDEIYELKDNIKLVYCVEKDNESFELLSEQYLDDNDIEKSGLFNLAVNNMKKKYPCKIISLEEFSKNHDAKISADNGEGVYVLCCEKDDFSYSSAAVFYSEEKIRQFSQDKGCDVYILPVNASETYLCTADIYAKIDIEEVMEEYALEDENFLTNEALVLSNERLISLKEYKEKTPTEKKKNNKKV